MGRFVSVRSVRQYLSQSSDRFVSYTDVVGLLDPCDSFRSSYGVRYSCSRDRCRVVVCDARFRVITFLQVLRLTKSLLWLFLLKTLCKYLFSSAKLSGEPQISHARLVKVCIVVAL